MKNLKYKLIISDYDGTLSDKNYINEEVIKAIQDYRKAGGKFALCTGRAIPSTSKFLGINGFNPDAVSFYQGSVIHVNGKPVLNSGIEKETVYDIIKSVRERWNRIFAVYIDDVLYSDSETETAQLYLSFYRQNGGTAVFVPDILEVVKNAKSNLAKFVVLKDPSDPATEVFEFIGQNFGDKVLVNSGASFIIEIVSKKYSKEEASKLIAKELGVSEEETLTIGDSTNDISLLKFGYGVAVASGTEELKMVAKYIAPPIQELPVKCIIEKILKGEDFN